MLNSGETTEEGFLELAAEGSGVLAPLEKFSSGFGVSCGRAGGQLLADGHKTLVRTLDMPIDVSHHVHKRKTSSREGGTKTIGQPQSGRPGDKNILQVK